MATCPNKSHPDWKKLTKEVGLYSTYVMYAKNGNKIPNLQKDINLPAPNKGMSSAQVKSALRRLKAYNTKMGTKHRLFFKQLGESTLYKYEIGENFNREKFIQSPSEAAMGYVNDVGDFVPPEYQLDAVGDPIAELDTKMAEFLNYINVDLRIVNEILGANNEPISAVAKADMLNRVVEVVEGKAGLDTLPEEAAHFMVKILKANNSPLYKSMMDDIGSYELFQGVVDDYSTVYKGDMERIKEEAVGKVIAQIIIAGEVTSEFPKKVQRMERWFDKVMNFLRKLFGKPSEDPYMSAALGIVNKQVNNIKKARESVLGEVPFYQLEKEAPKSDKARVEETVKLFEETQKRLRNVEVANSEVQKLAAQGDYIVVDPKGTTNRYEDTEENRIIANRITDRPSAEFIKKVGKEKAQQINDNYRNEIKREGGTRHHSTAEKIMLLIDKKVGSKEQIQRESGLTAEQFNKLAQGVQAIYVQAREQQRKIDPDGEFLIFTEQKVHDPVGKKGLVYEDTAGTADLVVLYSDNSADIYDYKFITPGDAYIAGFGEQAKIIATPHTAKMDGYNMQIAAYKDILMRRYGVSKVRKSRIVPVHVQYKTKVVNGKTKLTDEVALLEMEADSEFLKQIPVANELFGDKGIDTLIKKFTARRKKLEERRKGKFGEQWSKIGLEIASLDSAIQSLQLNGGLADILSDARTKMQVIQRKLGNNEPTLKDGSANPDYMTTEELLDNLESFGLYLGLTKYSAEFFKDVNANSTQTEKAKLKRLLDSYAGPIDRAYEALKEELATRTLEMGNEFGVKNATRQVKELGFMEKLFNTASEFSHPIFRTAWGYINRAQERTRKAQNKLEKEIKTKQDAVRDWAESKGMTLMDAYKGLVNEKTGNLIAKYSTEYFEKLENARKNKNVAWVKENFQPKENYKEKFKEWKDREFKRIDDMFADYKEMNEETGKYEVVKDNAKQREAKKQAWLNTHDLSRDSAWTSPKSWYHLDIKEDKKASFYSEDYKKIENDAPLREFYEFYREKNREFAQMTGLTIKSNFIANIHQDLIDSIAHGNYSPQTDSMFEGLKIRQDQGEYGVRNPITGELEAKIPMLYMNPIYNSQGEVDNKLKTKDLGRALYLMGKAAHNYAHKSEIEGNILALGNFLQDNPALLSDKKNNAFLDKTGELADKLVSKDTYETFEQLYINFYLYGQRIQTKDQDWGGYSKNRVILGAKEYFSAKVLGLAVIPGTAAYIAAKANAYFEGAKGLHYTNKQMSNTHRLFYKQKDVYMGLVNDFEIWQDDAQHRRANDLSASKLVKAATMDKLYVPYRKADEAIDNNVLVSMAQNYGVNEQGMPKRLELLPEGSKSILELAQESLNKTGKLSYGNMTEEGHNQFRNIAQHVAGTIKGQISDQDINYVNTTLAGNIAMQFKNWMPRMVRERLGAFKYNAKADVYEQGRYNVVAGEAFQLEENMFGYVKGALTTALKLSADATTFGLAYKMEPNMEVAEKLFNQYKQDNPDNPDIQAMSMPEFVDMRRRQIRAAASELRGILMLAASLLILGMKGDDDERLYTKTWLTRKVYASLSRTAMELGFLYNPNEFVGFARNPVPMSGIVIDALKAVNNTQDEFMDLITGRKDNRDKTPWGYYSMPFFPGYKQMSRLIEVYEQNKVNPY